MINNNKINICMLCCGVVVSNQALSTLSCCKNNVVDFFAQLDSLKKENSNAKNVNMTPY